MRKIMIPSTFNAQRGNYSTHCSKKRHAGRLACLQTGGF
jgi:hypothetical protein